jgi:kynureninase
MLKPHFTHALAALAARDTLHFAAHSHHPWPDCTQAAHHQYWQDSSLHLDNKWDSVLGEVLPSCQSHVALLLGTSDPKQIAFAPNTGEFVARLYSALDWRTSATSPIRVVTTDGEFHSFSRLTRRLEETGRITVTRVAVEPIDTFGDRFCDAIRMQSPQFVFCSHVFFETGLINADLNAIAAAAPADSIVVFDGYHAVMALPVDIRAIESRVFYMGGGYKYMMAGEGCCFMHVPAHAMQLRPVYTGWFAAFDELAAPNAQVGYASDGYRFFGATFDASGLYRMAAVQDWLKQLRIGPAEIRRHVISLQDALLAELNELNGPIADAARRLKTGLIGNYLSLAFDSDQRAQAIEHGFKQQKVMVDRRANRVRIGLGVYHDKDDIGTLLRRVAVLSLQNL